jgi:hypothetical protein
MTKNITKRFWDNIKTSNSISSLEDAFVVWSNKEKLDINSAKQAWIDINNEVKTIFAQIPTAVPQAPIENTTPPQQGGSLQIEDVKSGEDKGLTLIRGILTQEA